MIEMILVIIWLKIYNSRIRYLFESIYIYIISLRLSTIK